MEAPQNCPLAFERIKEVLLATNLQEARKVPVMFNIDDASRQEPWAAGGTSVLDWVLPGNCRVASWLLSSPELVLGFLPAH